MTVTIPDRCSPELHAQIQTFADAIDKGQARMVDVRTRELTAEQPNRAQFDAERRQIIADVRVELEQAFEGQIAAYLVAVLIGGAR